ncbi:MAG: hypothetical protein NTZ48_07400 [Candidatus Omnitrophica bacterium]|nr:hypothetical protein [Candidatus Omnitrophota bacterium]
MDSPTNPDYKKDNARVLRSVMELFLVIWIVWTLIGLGTNWGYGWRDDDDHRRR